MSAKSPFPHVASLNLFREPDGTHEITVAGASMHEVGAIPEGLRPIDHIENHIIAAAERMKARKLADGTYREIGNA